MEGSINLKTIRRHKWLTKKYDQSLSLGELISIVDPAISRHSKFELNNMNKILDQVGLILQNVNGVDLKISCESRGVRHLAGELGMLDHLESVVSDLKRVYKA